MKYGSYYTSEPLFYRSNKSNSKTIDNYHSSQNTSLLDILLHKKSKTKKIKPPFRKGLFSYKHSFNSSHNKFIKNKFKDNINHNLFSIDLNLDLNKENLNYNNNNNYNMIENDSKNYQPNYNSSLSFSTINLNKYKISMSSSENNKSYKENNYYSYKPYNNNIKNISITLNNNTNNNSSFRTGEKIYYNFFKDSNNYEKENRRMIIEYLKVMGRFGNKNSNNKFKKTAYDKKYVKNEFNNNEYLDGAKNHIHKNNINFFHFQFLVQLFHN